MPSSSRLILIVDDDKLVLKSCAKMASLCGFQTLTAADGHEALTLFRQHADVIDVVILDVIMPGMDGLSALHEIRTLRPDVKVIMCSGLDQDELMEQYTEHIPNGHLCKPYVMRDFEAELGRILSECSI